jgi:predicted Zn-dependent protease
VRNAQTPLGTLPTRYAVVYYNNLAYVFAGTSKASSGTPSSDPLFMSTIKTFRRLKESEFASSEPYRLKLVQAADGVKIEDVAKQSSIKKYPVETLRLLNDLYPNKEPAKGQWLKTVQ